MHDIHAPLNREETADQSPRRPAVNPPIDPVRVLVATGWLSPADAADPRLKLDLLTRVHQVARVTAPDGRTVIVKQPMPEARQSGRTLHRELCVYRLAGWIEPLAQVLPAPLLIDERRQLLVCEDLTAGRAWPDELALEPLTAPGVATGLGRAMADWHRATQGVALEASIAPGILFMTTELETALSGRSDSVQRFMRFVVDDAELRAALSEGAGAYNEALSREACLIHGDIRFDNWVVRRDRAATMISIFDWEMAGLGDPAWDVGSVCAEAMMQALRAGAATIAEATGWPVAAVPALRDFLGAYAAAGGSLDLRDPARSDRVSLFAVARLLHVAVEWAEYPQNLDGGDVALIVELARQLLRARQPAAASLARWVLA